MLAALTDAIPVVVGVVTSITAAVTAVARFKDRRPVSWLLERLVIQPARQAIEEQVEAAVIRTTLPVVQQNDAMAAMVRQIHYEMSPNSGHSLRDAVDRVEGTLIYTQGEVEKVKEHVSRNNDRLSRLEGTVDVLVNRHG